MVSVAVRSAFRTSAGGGGGAGSAGSSGGGGGGAAAAGAASGAFFSPQATSSTRLAERRIRFMGGAPFGWEMQASHPVCMDSTRTASVCAPPKNPSLRGARAAAESSAGGW
ncbi:MAG TPA: hypothetical protein DFR83_11470 [Deltaproteobacteria bacterium]|nr:hypothetical protein [Deltaproteobacteria bacterium]